MPISSLDDLYLQKLILIHDAEQRALEAYPALVEEIEDEELRQAMQVHMTETEQQVADLRTLLDEIGGDAMVMACESMQALIDETTRTMGEIDDPDTLHAYLIGAAQAMEHHEIAAYGTARAWAEQLGRDEDLVVLDRILDQEKATDAILTSLAERHVNREAAMADREVSLELGSDVEGEEADEAMADDTSSRRRGSQRQDEAR
jgi:ferritin-like metal-binding protein YciE